MTAAGDFGILARPRPTMYWLIGIAALLAAVGIVIGRTALSRSHHGKTVRDTADVPSTPREIRRSGFSLPKPPPLRVEPAGFIHLSRPAHSRSGLGHRH